MPEFQKLIAKLAKFHGAPALPPARGPFELVMWENACYLLPDERRALVFEGLRQQVGLDAESIWKADQAVLLPLAKMGGMRPETRVFRWREIARITLSQFGGNLDSILDLPYDKSKRALHQFPNIGQPGAEKILMLCGKSAGLPLESTDCACWNAWATGGRRKITAPHIDRCKTPSRERFPKSAALTRAHLLLRYHGKVVCRTSQPLCGECPLASDCAFAAKHL